jgi:hypothetical protein
MLLRCYAAAFLRIFVMCSVMRCNWHLLHAESSQTLYVNLVTQNDLLFTLSLSFVLWYYILGALPKYSKTPCFTKKEPLDWRQAKVIERHVETFLNNWKFYPWNHNIYIYSILLFVSKHKHLFKTNLTSHNMVVTYGSKQKSVFLAQLQYNSSHDVSIHTQCTFL